MSLQDWVAFARSILGVGALGLAIMYFFEWSPFDSAGLQSASQHLEESQTMAASRSLRSLGIHNRSRHAAYFWSERRIEPVSYREIGFSQAISG